MPFFLFFVFLSFCWILLGLFGTLGHLWQQQTRNMYSLFRFHVVLFSGIFPNLRGIHWVNDGKGQGNHCHGRQTTVPFMWMTLWCKKNLLNCSLDLLAPFFSSISRVLGVLCWGDLTAISGTTDGKRWENFFDNDEITNECWNEVHFIRSNATFRCQHIGQKEFNDRWNDLHFKRASSRFMCLWSNSAVSHLVCFMNHPKFITCETWLLYAACSTDQIQWHPALYNTYN